MNINIGTQNKSKINALAEIQNNYPYIADAQVVSCDVESGIADQPKSLDETITGAMNRARDSFKDCVYSFVLESGLMAVPHTKSGFMDVCVCAIFDGKEYHLGLSSAWEAPKQVMDYMLKDGMNMTDASVKAGLTDNPELGASEGLIGIMTAGKLNRKQYTQEAIRSALIHLGN